MVYIAYILIVKKKKGIQVLVVLSWVVGFKSDISPLFFI